MHFPPSCVQFPAGTVRPLRAGSPPHELKLSVNCVAMITRNMEGKFKNWRRVVVREVHRRTVVVTGADAYARYLCNPDENPLKAEGTMWVPRILFQWTQPQYALTSQPYLCIWRDGRLVDTSRK